MSKTNSRLHRRIFNVCEILDYSTLFIQLQAAPCVGHQILPKRSLHLEIPIWRDPSFSEFLKGGILYFGIPIWRDHTFQKFWKTHLFRRLLAIFLSCFLPFHGQFVCEMPLLQKKRLIWPSLAVRAPIVNFRHIWGVTTSCNVNRQRKNT